MPRSARFTVCGRSASNSPFPQHRELFAFGVVFKQRQRYEMLIAVHGRRGHAFDEVATLADADDFALLGREINGDGHGGA